MPAKRPRHTFTETEQVEAALQPLREQGVPVDFAALIIRGAEATLADKQHALDETNRRRQLREAFFLRGFEHFDLEPALAVRERAWRSA